MKLGQKAMEALRAEITGELKAGDDLVVAGDIALSGTALITEKEKETLKSYFSEGFLWDAQRSPSLYGAYDAEVLLGDRENLTCEQMNGRKRACAEKSSVWEAARDSVFRLPSISAPESLIKCAIISLMVLHLLS